MLKRNGRETVVYSDKGKNFYTTVWSGGNVFGGLELKRYQNFAPTFQERISVKTEDGAGTINSLLILDGKMVVFLSDKVEKRNRLYYQTYSPECLPIGKPVFVAEYSIPKGWNKTGYFNVLQSQNREFICVEYSIPATNSESEVFGYKVLDSKFKTVSEGTYVSTYDPKEADITNHYLSNTGDLFLGMKVYNTNDRGKVRDFTSLKKYVVFLIQGNEKTEVSLNIGDKRIVNMSFSSDEKRLLTCTGLYGEGNVRTKGAFYFQVDFKKQDLVNKGFSEFTKDFITQDWSEKQKQKADKREAKGKGSPELYDYEFREVFTTSNGGVIVVLEQYYVVVHTTTNPKTGATTTSYTYHYNDVIVYRVQANGEFDWIQRVNKRQVSRNDGGYLSSIGGYFTDKEFTFFFNDNNKNYTESGSFIDGNDGVYPASYKKKKNCVASVKIDLTTGSVTRKQFSSRAETSAFAVPKKFTPDYLNKEMFVYFQYGKKEKFGLLRFD